MADQLDARNARRMAPNADFLDIFQYYYRAQISGQKDIPSTEAIVDRRQIIYGM